MINLSQAAAHCDSTLSKDRGLIRIDQFNDINAMDEFNVGKCKFYDNLPAYDQ